MTGYPLALAASVIGLALAYWTGRRLLLALVAVFAALDARWRK